MANFPGHVYFVTGTRDPHLRNRVTGLSSQRSNFLVMTYVGRISNGGEVSERRHLKEKAKFKYTVTRGLSLKREEGQF